MMDWSRSGDGDDKSRAAGPLVGEFPCLRWRWLQPAAAAGAAKVSVFCSTQHKVVVVAVVRGSRGSRSRNCRAEL